jgi:two-component system, NarL family, response regulator LiaR
MSIRVMIVDDHAMVHIGLTAMLDACDGVELVAEASSAEEALRLCASTAIDVVLMDLLLPGMSGIEATRRIRQQYNTIQILAVTSYEDIEHVHAALKAGAVGYLLKNISASELRHAIENAYQGRSILSPEVSKALIAFSQRPNLPHEDLTEREREVLAYVARGMSNTQIAEILVVSPFTIKAHVSNILTKLNVVTRAEAAAYAVQHKLARLGD